LAKEFHGEIKFQVKSFFNQRQKPEDEGWMGKGAGTRPASRPWPLAVLPVSAGEFQVSSLQSVTTGKSDDDQEWRPGKSLTLKSDKREI
jgi:hypothetical protein